MKLSTRSLAFINALISLIVMQIGWRLITWSVIFVACTFTTSTPVVLVLSNRLEEMGISLPLVSPRFNLRLIFSRSLSDLKNRSEVVQAGKPQSGCSQNSAGRGQILPVNSCSIDQKSGEICTGQADLQPISFKSDRLPVGKFSQAVFPLLPPTWRG